MTNPLRKENFDEEDLTTADVAQGARVTEQNEAPKPVRSERPGTVAPFPDRSPSSLSEREATSFPQRPNTAAGESATGSFPNAEAGTSGRTEATTGSATPLFTNDEAQTFHARWNEVQASFVDEPRKAVQQADTLVATTMKRLAEVFAEERTNLEHQWDRGDNVSTEDLRVALQRYRSFFQRLLSI